ncbi:MAG: UDP-N-acetylmuramate--L-alanine ligase [Crocinitomicaceae bacterium]|jgi:UDP-N-acetylmuramate--alanine ligase
MNINLSSYKSIYFLGIGGIGMSALARYFKSKGFEVNGYDKTQTPLTDNLVKEGIGVHFEDLGESVKELVGELSETLVVLTPAIPKDMQEWNWLKEAGYTILKRSEVLGVITQNSKGLCVAGTHGKTTTSTLLAHILTHTGHECNAFLGGISSNYNTNYLPSLTSDYTVIEADEFDRSFLRLSPFASVITSNDPDHLDIYGNEANFLEGFQQYANLIDKEGVLVLKKGLKLTSNAMIKTYAIDDEADFSGSNLRFENGYQVFNVTFKGQVWDNVLLGLPGIHNAENALACVAMCDFLGLTESEIRKGLKSFTGVKRRFEYHVRDNELVYIDDYAHHPTEIHSLISSVRLLYPNHKITAVFQPHLFSRTNDFMEEFAIELSKVDELLIMPIYPARELPIEGVTSDVLRKKISKIKVSLLNHNQVLERLKNETKGVFLTVGAGDIDRLIQPLKQQFLANIG